MAVIPADAAELLRGGALAVLPTDTVYGIAAAAPDIDACARLSALKSLPATQATAVMFGSVERLLAELPGLPEEERAACRAVLPGPWTLVVANPARRLLHLCGDTPERIGVRVPDLVPGVADLADACGGLMISSANLRGCKAPSRLGDVDGEVLAAAAVVVDAGPLPGTPSAVVDLTGREPEVLRSGPRVDELLALVCR
jgi:L-threonylcarbamoyladenylate synthase